MTISRGLLVAAAVGVLLVAGTAEAGKRKHSRTVVPPASTADQGTPSNGQCNGTGSMGAGVGMSQGIGLGGPVLLQNFDDIDTDKNGQLSKAEIEAWTALTREHLRARVQQRFTEADANGDGKLSREEAQVRAQHLYEHFEFFDADGDGFVTLSELDQLRDRDQLRLRILDHLRRADQDHDGKLDLAELTAAFPGLAQRFRQMDRDGDGYLTPEDFLRGGHGF